MSLQARQKGAVVRPLPDTAQIKFEMNALRIVLRKFLMERRRSVGWYSSESLHKRTT